MPYFEDIKTFSHKVAVGNKPTQRISVDMGLTTYLNFILNESKVLFLKWGTDTKVDGKELNKLIHLMETAVSLTRDVPISFTILDYFRGIPEAATSVAILEATSYSPQYWQEFLSVIKTTYVPITEDKE